MVHITTHVGTGCSWRGTGVQLFQKFRTFDEGRIFIRIFRRSAVRPYLEPAELILHTYYVSLIFLCVLPDVSFTQLYLHLESFNQKFCNQLLSTCSWMHYIFLECIFWLIRHESNNDDVVCCGVFYCF